jgi:hypothetical protein
LFDFLTRQYAISIAIIAAHAILGRTSITIVDLYGKQFRIRTKSRNGRKFHFGAEAWDQWGRRVGCSFIVVSAAATLTKSITAHAFHGIGKAVDRHGAAEIDVGNLTRDAV